MEIKTITKENCFNVLSNLKQGPTIINYDNDKTREFVNFIIEKVVTFYKATYIREQPDSTSELVMHKDNKMRYEQKAIEGQYCLIVARGYVLPDFTDDDLYFEKYIDECAEQQTCREIKVKDEFLSKVRSYCFKRGVKFINKLGLQMIEGRQKKKSIYRQLEEAFKAGHDSISFDSADFNMPTIRTYVSQLGSLSGHKFRCAVVQDKVIVYFKEPSLKESLTYQAQELFNKIKIQLSEEEAFDIFTDVRWSGEDEDIEKSEYSEKPVAPEWGKHMLTGATPDDGSDYVSDYVEYDHPAPAYEPKPAYVLNTEPAPKDDSDMVILTDEEVDYSKPWVEPIVEPQHGTDHIGLWRIVDGQKIYDHRFEDKVAEVDGLKRYVAPLDEVSKEPKKNEWSFD